MHERYTELGVCPVCKEPVGYMTKVLPGWICVKCEHEGRRPIGKDDYPWWRVFIHAVLCFWGLHFWICLKDEYHYCPWCEQGHWLI